MLPVDPEPGPAERGRNRGRAQTPLQLRAPLSHQVYSKAEGLHFSGDD